MAKQTGNAVNYLRAKAIPIKQIAFGSPGHRRPRDPVCESHHRCQTDLIGITSAPTFYRSR